MPFLPTAHGTDVMIAGDDVGGSDKYGSKQKCPHCTRMFATRSGMLAHMDKLHFEEAE